MRPIHALSGAYTVALLAAGCATPPAVLEQAQFTAAAMGSLDQSMAEFRRRESNYEQASLASLAFARRSLVASVQRTSPELRAREAAGDFETLSAIHRLETEADALRADALAAEAASMADATRLSGVVTPVPDVGPSVAVAQAAMAAEAVETSPSQRLREARAFVSAVQKAAADNRKKIEAAEDAAAAAKKSADQATARASH